MGVDWTITSTDLGAARGNAPVAPRETAHGTAHGTSPATIGPYRVERRLGSGGFGEIFAARDADGRAVAVKRMRRELALRAEAILRFEREIEVVRRIRHPNLVDILGVGDDVAPYFAMELLHGADLARHLRQVGRLSPAEALEVLVPVGHALTAAHAEGVVHRDLKASNVFLDRHRVVLLDFGVAKLLDDSGPQLTRSHILIGSPPCMAPEQILGQLIDQRTDVYGLGALAYHVLTGSPPFVHEQPTVVREMHLVAPPPPVSRRAPVRPEIDRVIGRAMSKDPAARQASVAELVRDLEIAARAAAPLADGGVSLAVHVDTADGERLPEIVRDLTRAGMEIAFEAVNAATLLLPLSLDPGASRAQRRRALALVADASRTCEAACFVNVGSPAALLKLGAWIPPIAMSGVMVVPDALEGLDSEVEPVAGQRLVRLVDGPLGPGGER